MVYSKTFFQIVFVCTTYSTAIILLREHFIIILGTNTEVPLYLIITMIFSTRHTAYVMARFTRRVKPILVWLRRRAFNVKLTQRKVAIATFAVASFFRFFLKFGNLFLCHSAKITMSSKMSRPKSNNKLDTNCNKSQAHNGLQREHHNIKTVIGE